MSRCERFPVFWTIGTISRVFAPLVYRMPVMRPWASRRHSADCPRARQAAVMGAIGIAISFAGSRGLTIALNAPGFDPLLLSAVPVVLFATTLLAALAPARRASAIDPQDALRQD